MPTVFVIDVSWHAVNSGLVEQAAQAVLEAVYDRDGNSKLEPNAKIGIITFDKTVHFYNLSVYLAL